VPNAGDGLFGGTPMRPDLREDIIFLLLLLVVIVVSGIGAYYYAIWIEGLC
jgi:hypothetical protein